MKSILVPTDFSEISRNAASYAIHYAAYYQFDRIVLYNAYQAPVIAEPTIPAIQVVDFDTLRNISTSGLEQFRSDLLPLAGDAIKIEFLSEFGSLDAGINDICQRVKADLIVMGIAGGSGFEERIIGSTATSVAQHTTTPLFIIPPEATFVALEIIVLACDFKKVEQSTPFTEVRNLLNTTKAKLSILHIEENDKHPDDVLEQQLILQHELKDYAPGFFFIKNSDFVEGIEEYTSANKVDLIITVPKKHGLFERLFRRSHVKHLAFHTTIPLLCIHEDA